MTETASFARVAPALLAATTEIGGLDVAFATRLEPHTREEVVVCVHGAGTMAVGQRLACPTDLRERFGLASFVAVPIVGPSHDLYGTLCAAGVEDRTITPPTIAAMECFAGLLADALTCDALAAAELRADVAEQQLRSRAQFLAEAEHRLKSPLSVIAGWAGMLHEERERLTVADQVRGVAIIKEQSEFLFDEVAELLEEASAEGRARKLKLVDVDLAELVRKTAGDLAGSLPHHVVKANGTHVVNVVADVALVRQVISHLVDNAAKYSPDWSCIELSTESAGEWAVIDVRDEGVGLPPGMDVFAAFERGPDPLMGAARGVGLGLHIVRKLVLALGGEVAARSNDGPGSTFTVRLPTP